MEHVFEFKDIVWGFDQTTLEKNIIAYKDGVAKISYGDADFGADEEVIGFFTIGKLLYAIITEFDASPAYRVMRLDKINSMELDTWTDIITVAGHFAESFTYWEDDVYIFSTTGVYLVDVIEETETLVTAAMPAGIVSTNSSIYIGDRIFCHMAISASKYKLFEYDGSTTFIEIGEYFFNYAFSGNHAYSRRFLDELNGWVYYPQIVGGGAAAQIWRYNYDTGVHEFMSGESPVINFTHLVFNDNILYAAYATTTNPSTASIDIMMVVPTEYRYVVEKDLVSGEGAVHESLERVDSDPVFMVNGGKANKLYPYNEYTSLANLQGVLSPVIKYGSRLEYYTDLNDANLVANLTLKEIIDQLVSLSDMYFTVSASNVANIQSRDLAGYNDAFMTIKNSNDYGDDYIRDVGRVEPYPQNFKRITISWENLKWSTNEPVTAGASEVLGYAALDYGSDFVNNPILAKDIALYLLGKMGSVEQLTASLGMAYFLEGGENIIFKVYEDYVYLDESKEWKLFQVDHNIKDKTTSVVLIERVLIDEREEI